MEKVLSLPFYFDQHIPGDIARTWHVKREEFDQLLLDNAKSLGVHVLENVKVTEFITQDHYFVGVKAVKHVNK